MYILLIVVILEAVAVAAGAIRYLRIAQREHYIAFSVSKFAIRWYKFNGSYFFLIFALVAAIISFWFWPLSILSIIFLLVSPLYLTYKGKTSRLVFTRRLKVIAGTSWLIYFLLLLIIALILPEKLYGMSVVILAILVPFFIDLALLINSPIENGLSRKYLLQAQKKLKEIDPVVVGITGSYGKTSTKVLAGHFLSHFKETVVSPKSFNNKNGLTRTVLENLHHRTNVLVAEMGTYGKGEIKQMVSWLKPEVAALVSIGPVHLERMKTLENILSAKSEIFEFAKYAVLNVDNELISNIADKLKHGELGFDPMRVCKCSVDEAKLDTADVVLITNNEVAKLYINAQSVGEFSLGTDNAPAINVAIAIGISLYFGIKSEELVNLTQNLPTVDHRATVSVAENGIVLVDDTFNSNPAGAELALARAKSRLKPKSKLYVVTPGMVEMGSLQYDANRKFARLVKESDGMLLAVKNTNKKALLSVGARSKWFVNRQEVTSWIKNNCSSDDVILFENDLPDHYP